MRSFSIPLLSLSPRSTPSSLTPFLSLLPVPPSASLPPPLAFSCSSLSSPLVSQPHLNIGPTHSIYRRPRKMITNNGGKTRISSLSVTRIAYRPFRVQRHYVRYFISLFASPFRIERAPICSFRFNLSTLVSFYPLNYPRCNWN